MTLTYPDSKPETSLATSPSVHLYKMWVIYMSLIELL